VSSQIMKLECIYGVLFVVTLGNVATLDTLMPFAPLV